MSRLVSGWMVALAGAVLAGACGVSEVFAAPEQGNSAISVPSIQSDGYAYKKDNDVIVIPSVDGSVVTAVPATKNDEATQDEVVEEEDNKSAETTAAEGTAATDGTTAVDSSVVAATAPAVQRDGVENKNGGTIATTKAAAAVTAISSRFTSSFKAPVLPANVAIGSSVLSALGQYSDTNSDKLEQSISK